MVKPQQAGEIMYGKERSLILSDCGCLQRSSHRFDLRL